MGHSKACSYLGALTKSELIEFNKFINSPYFNTSKKIIRLFNYIRKYHPDFKSPALEKEKIFQYVFDSKKVNNGTLNNLFTKLIKLTEDYMTLKQNFDNEANTHISLMTQLINRKLISEINTKYEKLIIKPDSNVQSDPDFFLNNYKLKKALIRHSYFKSSSLKLEPIFKNLSDAYGDLLKFYYIHSMRDYFRILILRQSLRLDMSKYDNLYILENTIKNSNIIPDNPVLNIYRLFLGIFDTDNKPDYYILKESLLKLKDKISDSDFNFLLVMLYMYGNSLESDQSKAFGIEIFNLLKFILNRKIWTKDSDYMNELIYYSIVKTAIRINNYEWAENFINLYLSKLVDENRYDIKNLCMAEICFSKAQNTHTGSIDLYSKALEYLAKFKSQEFYSKCRIFNLVIMIYFETDELEYLYYQCDSYQHYLKGHINKLSDEEYKRNLNFIQFCLNLAKLKQDADDNSKKKLSISIKNETLCINYNWLNKKIKELMKK